MVTTNRTRLILHGSSMALALATIACAAMPADTQTAVQECITAGPDVAELEVGRRPAETDTILSIQHPTAHPNSLTGFASLDWISKHQSFEFRGERYFMMARGLRGNQFRGRVTRATIAPIGEHDGVTLYTWQPVRSDTLTELFVRFERPCGLWQYWHVSQVRH